MAKTVNVYDTTDGCIEGYTDLWLEFDGLMEPRNPNGISTVGWLIRDANDMENVLVKSYEFVIDATNLDKGLSHTFSEYCALGKALDWLVGYGWSGNLDVRGDSKAVVLQVKEVWECHKQSTRLLRDRVLELIKNLGLDLQKNLTIEWVARNDNKEADLLARIAYETHCESKGIPIVYMEKRGGNAGNKRKN